jgi:hypothetical protein
MQRLPRTLGALICIAAIGTASTGCGGDATPSPTTSIPPAPVVTESTAAAAAAPDPPSVEPGITVREALESPDGATVAVDGFLIAAEGHDVLLAERLAESHPPQPGGATLVVEGLDPRAVPGAITDMGVTWTDGAVQLIGTISDGILRVDAAGR